MRTAQRTAAHTKKPAQCGQQAALRTAWPRPPGEVQSASVAACALSQARKLALTSASNGAPQCSHSRRSRAATVPATHSPQLWVGLSTEKSTAASSSRPAGASAATWLARPSSARVGVWLNLQGGRPYARSARATDTGGCTYCCRRLTRCCFRACSCWPAGPAASAGGLAHRTSARRHRRVLPAAAGAAAAAASWQGQLRVVEGNWDPLQNILVCISFGCEGSASCRKASSNPRAKDRQLVVHHPQCSQGRFWGALGARVKRGLELANACCGRMLWWSRSHLLDRCMITAEHHSSQNKSCR